MNQGTEHGHSFSVDTSCECGIALSVYVRQLKIRTIDLESKIGWYQEHLRKMEARADSADFTCNEAQRGEQDLWKRITAYRDLWRRVHEWGVRGLAEPTVEERIALGYVRGELFGDHFVPEPNT